MLPPNVIRTAGRTFATLGPEDPGLAHFRSDVCSLEGLTAIGAHLEVLPPGHGSSPLHHHHVQEEHLLVLEGILSVRERLGDGSERRFDVPAGELVAWPGGTGISHAIRNLTDSPVRVLAVSDVPPGDLVVYPDSGKVLASGLGVGVIEPRPASPPEPPSWPEPAQPPAHVTSPRRVPEQSLGATHGRPLARAVGARAVFLNLDRLPPGTVTSPLHRHSANQELVLVLEGAPELRQVRDGSEELVGLQPGDVVWWAPGDGIAHQIRNPSVSDVRLAVVGTDRPEDVLFLPERGVVHVPALDLAGPFRPTSYWDGER